MQPPDTTSNLQRAGGLGVWPRLYRLPQQGIGSNVQRCSWGVPMPVNLAGLRPALLTLARVLAGTFVVAVLVGCEWQSPQEAMEVLAQSHLSSPRTSPMCLDPSEIKLEIDTDLEVGRQLLASKLVEQRDTTWVFRHEALQEGRLCYAVGKLLYVEEPVKDKTDSKKYSAHYYYRVHRSANWARHPQVIEKLKLRSEGHEYHDTVHALADKDGWHLRLARP